MTDKKIGLPTKNSSTDQKNYISVTLFYQYTDRKIIFLFFLLVFVFSYQFCTDREILVSGSDI